VKREVDSCYLFISHDRTSTCKNMNREEIPKYDHLPFIVVIMIKHRFEKKPTKIYCT
jgi:hypothetical protein